MRWLCHLLVSLLTLNQVMLSGIGDAQYLTSKGVKPLVDLPAVGQNLHVNHEPYTCRDIVPDSACLGSQLPRELLASELERYS